MTKEQEKVLLQERINRLSGSVKNIKCPGVLRKLNRKMRNMNK